MHVKKSSTNIHCGYLIFKLTALGIEPATY